MSLITIQYVLSQFQPLKSAFNLVIAAAPDTITKFFNALATDLGGIVVAAGACFLAWAGILYLASGMTGEKGKQQAMVGIYAVVIGIGLVLLAPSIAQMVWDAFQSTK